MVDTRQVTPPAGVPRSQRIQPDRTHADRQRKPPPQPPAPAVERDDQEPPEPAGDEHIDTYA